MPIHIYRKHLTRKIENFQIKNGNWFLISAQNIDCGYSLEPPRRGGSNEYPQSMFLSRNKKMMHTPVNPSFTLYKWGFRGSKLYSHVFVMCIKQRRVIKSYSSGLIKRNKCKFICTKQVHVPI